MISNLSTLIDTFKQMNDNGWDTGGYLKWGFYFFDIYQRHLMAVFDELKGSGYNLEQLEEMDDGLWQLYVTKIDILTPEKLHKRNIAFNELAQYCNVQLYDGWDVERVGV